MLTLALYRSTFRRPTWIREHPLSGTSYRSQGSCSPCPRCVLTHADLRRRRSAELCSAIAQGWTSIASDYNVHLPRDTPPARIFFVTWLGTYLPIIFTCITSAAWQTISKQSYVDAREADALGGIVGAILGPAGGFGKFLLVLLAFSTIAANTPNTCE